MALNLNYYYGSEADQFSFYRIPKLLFTEPAYESLASEAKILYGMMLDRMGLSIRNNWVDSLGRVYIYFTLEEALEMLHLGRNKAIRLFRELDEIGLIDRKKQGQGKPTIIYVKNFILPQTAPLQRKPVSEENYSNEQESPSSSAQIRQPLDRPSRGGKTQDRVSQRMERMVAPLEEQAVANYQNQSFLRTQTGCSANIGQGSQEVLSQEVLKSPNGMSANSETGRREVSKSNPNNTEDNNTYLSDTDVSIPPFTPPADISLMETSFSPKPRGPGAMDGDKMEQREQAAKLEIYRAIIRENVEYDILLEENGADAALIDGYIDLMADVCVSNRGSIRVNRQDMSPEVVKSRFLKLRRDHIEYVLDCLKKNTTRIGNIRSYMLSALYNAPVTLDQYFASWVSHDAAQRYNHGVA